MVSVQGFYLCPRGLESDLAGKNIPWTSSSETRVYSWKMHGTKVPGTILEAAPAGSASEM